MLVVRFAKEREKERLGLQGSRVEAQQQSHNCGFMLHASENKAASKEEEEEEEKEEGQIKEARRN